MNLASLMLMYPDLDVRRPLSRLETPIFGSGLHWMTQCHGAIELAAALKQGHPHALPYLAASRRPTIFCLFARWCRSLTLDAGSSKSRLSMATVSFTAHWENTARSC